MRTRTPTERHRRTETTGYPSCGCVPAEPNSVSPVNARILNRQPRFNPPSIIETHASKNPTPLSTYCTKIEFENLFSNLSLTLFRTVADTFCSFPRRARTIGIPACLPDSWTHCAGQQIHRSKCQCRRILVKFMEFPDKKQLSSVLLRRSAVNGVCDVSPRLP